MGRRPRLARRNLSLIALRPAHHDPSLPGQRESVLHGARSRAPRTRSLRGRISSRRLRRNHRRIAAHDLLLQRIHEHNLPEEAFKWYLDLRKYGSVPHSGFGMGIERAVAWICGLEHVRETIPFPRMLHRLYP